VKEIIKADTGRYPRDYKRLELAKLNKYFTTISYKSTTNFDFASEVMSGLIVLHGLPNTNHRSTILFVAMVFEIQKIKFPYYEVKTDKKRWIDDCNRFIAKSKRILYSRKRDSYYQQKHLEWTKEWLAQVIVNQSNSSGMMSRKSLTTLRKISSSFGSSSVIVKK
jgi:prophage maintenance system killer protein